MNIYVKVRNTEKSESKKSSGLPIGKEYWRVFYATTESHATILAQDLGYEVLQVTTNLHLAKGALNDHDHDHDHNHNHNISTDHNT